LQHGSGGGRGEGAQVSGDAAGVIHVGPCR
jgi:hypothetical protein